MDDKVKHLMDTTFATMEPEKRKAICKKGADASNKKRRETKLLRETLSLILSLPIKDDAIREKLRQIGIEDEEMTQQTLLALAMVKGAQGGNAYTAAFIRDTLGQKEVERIEMVNPVQIVVEDDYGNQLTPVPPVKQIPGRGKK